MKEGDPFHFCVWQELGISVWINSHTINSNSHNDGIIIINLLVIPASHSLTMGYNNKYLIWGAFVSVDAISLIMPGWPVGVYSNI